MNSVFKVTSLTVDYDPSMPFATRVSDDVAAGTCFCARLPASGRVVLLTNAHVVEHAHKGAVCISREHLGLGPVAGVQVQMICPQIDVAVLDASKLASVRPLTLSCSAPPADVLIHGYPLASQRLRTSAGSIDGAYHDAAGAPYFNIAGSINNGNSGGPVTCARTNAVVGIACATMADSEALSLAVPAKAVLRAIAEWEQQRVPRLLRLPTLDITTVPVDAHFAHMRRLPNCSGARVVTSAAATLQSDDVVLAVGARGACRVNELGHVVVDELSAAEGVPIDSVSCSLSLPLAARVPLQICRANVEGAVTVVVNRTLPTYPDTTWPLWEAHDRVHYVTLIDGLVLVPLTHNLLAAFEADGTDAAYVAAAAQLDAAGGGATAVAWVQPHSAAAAASVQPLMLLQRIDDKPANNIDACAAVVRAWQAETRLGKRRRYMRLHFNHHFSCVLPKLVDRMQVKNYCTI
tara:strand:+ start:332 stop:1720 length:1389 start_codon:yes stop_codon:yes gene_type:complete